MSKKEKRLAMTEQVCCQSRTYDRSEGLSEFIRRVLDEPAVFEDLSTRYASFKVVTERHLRFIVD